MRVGSRQVQNLWLCIKVSVVQKKQKQNWSKKNVLVKGNISCGLPLPNYVYLWVL